MAIWSRTYVCCAVPLYNSGIYAILAQFLIISIVTGVLCFAAPAIISVTTPDFVSFILGVLCFVVAACQLFGFVGVLRDKPRLFKTYLRINGLLVGAALALALALIIISAVRHSTGVEQCTQLFSADNTDSTARNICNVWTWIQVGIMGLLFVIVALCELYFVAYTSIYASEQRLDHARYDSVYSNAAHEIRQSGLYDVHAAAGGRPSYAPGDSDDLIAPAGGYAYAPGDSDDLIAPAGGYAYAGGAGGHAREGSRSSGLRNELARGGGGGGIGEEVEGRYDDDGYRSQHHQQQQQQQRGGKLRKGGAVNAASVVGYRDEEEYAPYDYDRRGGGGGGEGGFRPPHQSSETRRW